MLAGLESSVAEVALAARSACRRRQCREATRLVSIRAARGSRLVVRTPARPGHAGPRRTGVARGVGRAFLRQPREGARAGRRAREPRPRTRRRPGRGAATLPSRSDHGRGRPGVQCGRRACRRRARARASRSRIIDAGFGQYALRQAAGELPWRASLKAQNYCGDFEQHLHGTAGCRPRQRSGARGAELHLICIEDAVDMGAATDYVLANGIRLVNLLRRLLQHIARRRGSGPDSPDGLVAQARAAGRLVVASAGNMAKYHWSGAFVDADGDGLGEFVLGDEGNEFRTRGGELTLRLPQVGCLADDRARLRPAPADGVGKPVRRLCEPADRRPAPDRGILLHARRRRTRFPLAIRGPPGAKALRFDLFLIATARGTLQHQTPAAASLEPASGPQALAAGAVCWQTGVLASYSSQGPRSAAVSSPISPASTASRRRRTAGSPSASSPASASAAPPPPHPTSPGWPR